MRPVALLISLLPSLGFAASLGQGSALAAEPPVYLPGSHYGAELVRRSGTWHLLSPDGGLVGVRQLDCAPVAAADLPAGLWLLTRDADGQPELVAPSATSLPIGHRGRIRVRACRGGESAGAPSIAAPFAVLETLADGTGAILVHD